MATKLRIGTGGDILRFQKRMASEVLEVGPRHVWLDPTKRGLISQARTREAIRKLIAEDVIQFKPALRGYRTKIDAVMLSSHKKYQMIKQKYKPVEESRE